MSSIQWLEQFASNSDRLFNGAFAESETTSAVAANSELGAILENRRNMICAVFAPDEGEVGHREH